MQRYRIFSTSTSKCTNNQVLSFEIIRHFTQIREQLPQSECLPEITKLKYNSIFLILWHKGSRYIPADAGFLCNKAIMLIAKVKDKPTRSMVFKTEGIKPLLPKAWICINISFSFCQCYFDTDYRCYLISLEVKFLSHYTNHTC
jgi:hypothetical protein